MTGGFGRVPYRRANYGPLIDAVAAVDLRNRLEGPKSESGQLEALLGLLKAGDRDVVRRLADLFSSKSADVRGYAGDLYAAVCSRRQVLEMKHLLDAARDPEEISRAMVSIGLSLCPEGVLLVLDYRRNVDSELFDDYVFDVVANLLGVEVQTIGDIDETEAFCRKVLSELNPFAYYYGGRPVFVGDLTKAVVTHATVALREQHPFALAQEPWLLADFSGVSCPVAYGQLVDERIFQEIVAYAKHLGEMSWVRGHKYFYRVTVDTLH